MKCFQLHEDTGEPDSVKKTDDLHAFLHPLCVDTEHDFEGSNSGLQIYLSVKIGDTMILREDGSIRVLPKGEKVIIDAVSFPHVYKAFLAVEYDNGAHHVNRIARESGGTAASPIDLTKFEMPYDYGVEKLCRAENAMAALARIRGSESQVEDFVCGEQGEQEEIIKLLKPKIPDLQIAHDLINDWFNAWETA
jgi:hypothetical protein